MHIARIVPYLAVAAALAGIPAGPALAQALGGRGVVLMRGHGAVVVGSPLQDAVGRSVYLQINAALQRQAISLGGSVQYLDPDEARKLEAIPNRYQRAWEMWKRKAQR